MGGMFQPQNYGADFVNSMTATAGMLDNRRRLDMEEKRQAREEETRTLQNTAARQTIAANEIDMAKKKADYDADQTYGQLFQAYRRKQTDPTYQYSDEDVKLAGKALGITPGVPNDPAQFPQALKNMNTLLEASQTVRNVPPGLSIIRRGDNPQYDAVFDAQQSLLSPNHLGQEHTDRDGSVTGKAGTVYKTAGIGGSGIISGEGSQASFLPLYNVTLLDGTPVIDPATNKPKLVPRTDDRSNNPNAKLSPLTPENLQMMVGARVAQMKAVEDMIAADPKNREKIMEAALQASMSTDEKKKLVQKQMETKAAANALRSQLDGMPEGLARQQVQVAVNMLESGSAGSIKEALELAKIGKPDRVTITLPEGAKAGEYNPVTGKYEETFANPKAEKPEAPHTVFTGVKGSDLTRQFPEAKGLKPNGYYNVSKMNGQLYFAEERPPKYAGEGGGGKGGSGGTGVDDKTLKGLQQRYKELDRQRLAQYAKDEAELRQVNAKRAELPDTPPLTHKQYFGGEESPAHQAITKDMYQLRDIAAANYKYDLVGMRPLAKQQAAPAQKGIAQAPPAKQQAAQPITATNHQTGQRIVSHDGGRSWQPIGQPAAPPKQPQPAKPQPKPAPTMAPAPPKKKGPNFYEEMSAGSKRLAEEKATKDAAKARATAVNTDPSTYVTAYDSKGNSYRTKAANARFNTASLRWELK